MSDQFSPIASHLNTINTNIVYENLVVFQFTTQHMNGCRLFITSFLKTRNHYIFWFKSAHIG